MHKTVQKLCTIVKNVRREVYTENAQISAKNVHNCAKIYTKVYMCTVPQLIHTAIHKL